MLSLVLKKLSAIFWTKKAWFSVILNYFSDNKVNNVEDIACRKT